MAKVDVERAYVKCLVKAPLLREELDVLIGLSASDLMEYGTVGESSWVREWIRHETYRQRAQDVMYGKNPEDDGRGFKKPPTHTYPFYDSE